MEKIDFINNQQPALNATNLNKLQQNVEDDIGDLTELETSAKNNLVEAINEAASTGGNINVYNEYTTSTTDTYSCDYINGLETYSTTETKTNKVWIDGKPIYRKVIIGTTTIASGNYTVAHDISNLGDIVDFKYYSWQNSTTMFIGSTSPLDESAKLSVYINGNNITVRNSWESIKRVIILEYTKTTDGGNS